jgi:hypothetical protein
MAAPIRALKCAFIGPGAKGGYYPTGTAYGRLKPGLKVARNRSWERSEWFPGRIQVYRRNARYQSLGRRMACGGLYVLPASTSASAIDIDDKKWLCEKCRDAVRYSQGRHR